MRFYIVIPAHNEEAYIGRTLDSLAKQSLLPARIVVVNDHSTDATSSILETYVNRYDFIDAVHVVSSEEHAPGSKIVAAFYKGFEQLDEQFDIICKFDADLEFPKDYLERISELFKNNPRCGIAGGYCYIEKHGKWQLENLTSKDHIRGALKAYRKDCFEQINGLKPDMGWDTVDEMLGLYHGWQICTDERLKVRHLKPTGASYSKKAGIRQGEAFRKMRYGLFLTIIASAKLALKKQRPGYFFNCLVGFFRFEGAYFVSPEEGKFIRSLRWKRMRAKYF